MAHLNRVESKPHISRGMGTRVVLQPGVGPQGLPGPGAAAWTAAQAVTAGAVRQAPDGSWIKSTATRTTGASFDATEQTFWTTVLATTGTLEQTALSATYAAKATANTFTAKQTMPEIQLGTTAGSSLVAVDTLGTHGRRWSLQPTDTASANASQLQLIPGTGLASATSVPSQILLYNKVGTDYERFVFSCVNNQYVIDSTYNGVGVARNIYIQMGGSVGGAIAGRNAATFYADASVDLPGATFVADAKTWHATRTRIADATNTGDSRLIIDTRTGTPTSNVADSATIELRRGNAAKWNVGLNYAGNNADTLDFYDRVNAVNRMRLLPTGELKVKGDAPAVYGGTLKLINTGTGGHEWRIGEFWGAASLAFRDVTTGVNALQLASTGSALVGLTAPATTATGGFPYIPVMAGTPTGVPVAQAGYVPMVFDSTGVKLWIYTGGAWKGVVVA